MFRLHAVFLAVALAGQTAYAQAPAAGKGDIDDDIRRLLRKLAPVPLPHGESVSSVIFSRDGRSVVTVSNSAAKVHVWDSATGELLRQWQLPESQVKRSALAVDGKLLATTDSAGRVTLWDVPGGKRLRALKGSLGTGVALSPDGKSVVAGTPEGELGVWDAATGRFRASLPKSSWSLGTTVAISQDGRRIAAGRMDGTIGVWDAATGKAVRSLPGDGFNLHLLAFTPSGNGLASAGRSGLVRLWDVATGKERRQIQMPGGHDLNCGFFTPDGRALLTGGADGTVRLWEAASGRERHRFPAQRGSVAAAALAVDAHSVAIVGANNMTLVREVGARAASEQVLGLAPAPKDLEEAWADLAAPDAAKAYRAVAALAGRRGEAVAYLKQRLQPAVAAAPAEVAKLVRELDSKVYATREKAMRELVRLHADAESALKASLQDLPLEARRRALQLLDRIRRQDVPPERLRPLLAVEALESIGTAEARQVLQAVAGGAAGDPLTEEARAALARLRKGE
jgi:hypothetical protein